MSRFLDTLDVTPLADGVNWRFNADFRYESTLLARTILIPGPIAAENKGGFVTDFTSSPRAIWSIVPPWGRHGPAACVHDRLYWDQTTTREEADQVLREACQVLGVEPSLISKIYLGVRVGGEQSWERNAELKAAGFTRLASAADNPPYAAAI